MISKNVDLVTQSSRGKKATSFDITTITVVCLCVKEHRVHSKLQLHFYIYVFQHWR